MSGGGSGSELVCSYHRSDVYEADLATLEPGQWLNDTIINFCLEYCKHDVCGGSRRLAFVYPGVSFVLAHEEDEEDFHHTLTGAGVGDDCELALFPINDKAVDGRPGGAHWSLLAFDRKAGEFVHLDSSGGANGHVARNLAERLWPHLGGGGGRPLRFHDSAPCPQQPNAYDCGVYAVMFAREAAEAFLETGAGPASDATTERLKERVTGDAVAAERRAIVERARAKGSAK